MQVDFNGLRRNLINAYNDLVEHLNEKVESTGGMTEIEIELEDIEQAIDELRTCIATLAMLYEESFGIESLKDVHLKLLCTDYQD